MNQEGGDRHSIVVMPGVGSIWETWLTQLTATGWEASNGAKFDLKSNALRPHGWTSGDAAGLPMFPALVRYDECQRGIVEHAMRIVVKRTRLGPIYPATHHASVGSLTDPNIPAMGQRLRLKGGFSIPENWNIYEKAVLRGLKKYGAIVADNGNFFSISVTPDDRYPSSAFTRLSTLSITNFEVIVTTGPLEGPRSSGVPVANAGEDETALVGQPLQLKGSLIAPNSPVAVQTEWDLYSGPASVAWSDRLLTNARVTFSAPGEYILRLAARNNIHTPAFDAVRVTVTDSLLVNAQKDGTGIILTWGGNGELCVVESAADLSGNWTPLATTIETTFRIDASVEKQFFRVRRD